MRYLGGKASMVNKGKYMRATEKLFICNGRPL